jgi:glyoxylase-like metal-dependent hydrolase (beta-lactamase superfamily II)
MRIFDAGKIAPDFYVNGPPGGPVYLLDAPRPALFDAGISAFAHAYIDDIRAALGGRPPAYLFLTHAHFDHVGAAGVFKRVWPDLQIVGSAQSAQILQRPGAIELITLLNNGSLDLAREQGFAPLNEEPFVPVQVDRAAAADEIFDLGDGRTVQALAAPGHTRDFTSYWIAARKILVASEAAGNNDGTGAVLPEFLVDIDGYLANIARFARLDVEILCPGHKLVLTGDDAREHLRRSPAATHRYLAMAEEFLRDTRGDLDAAAEMIKEAEWEPLPWPKQPEQAYMLNTRQRMLKVWERMQARGH